MKGITMEYKVKGTDILYNGKVYAEGQTIDLNEKDAKAISDYLESQTIRQNAQTEYIVAKTKLEVCKSEYLKAIGEI